MLSLLRPARLLLPVLCCALLAIPARAGELEDTITKARAYLGSEKDIGALTSVKFVGTIQDDKGGAAEIEILFQKPLYHRFTLKTKDTVETKALDDYEGWRHAKAADGRWSLRILDSMEVSRLRAVVWENLNFFRGIEKVGGSAVVKGRETVDGVEAVKIEFQHGEDAVFTRYFERKTGRLVMTQSDMNTQIREEGEVRAGGLRFPKKLITTAVVEEPATDGGAPKKVTRTTTITFDSITVNEAFPRSAFSVPLFTDMP